MPVALITGASAGIGEALARELAKRGWTLGLVARRQPLLDELAEELRKGGATVATASADVTDRAQVEAAVRSIEAAVGPVDLLVANAGGGTPSPAKAVPVDALVDVMRLNYFGVVYSVGAVLPGMLARRSGHISVVSSVAGFRGLPGGAAYSASKAAVSTMFESFRTDLRGTGVAVSTIHPGYVETPLTAKNRYPMPFLMKADRAARIIADGLQAKRTDITFPWQMAWLLRYFLVRLPNALWDRALAGQTRKLPP